MKQEVMISCLEWCNFLEFNLLVYRGYEATGTGMLGTLSQDMQEDVYHIGKRELKGVKTRKERRREDERNETGRAETGMDR